MTITVLLERLQIAGAIARHFPERGIGECIGKVGSVLAAPDETTRHWSAKQWRERCRASGRQTHLMAEGRPRLPLRLARQCGLGGPRFSLSLGSAT